MTTYTYRIIDKSGRQKRGNIEAEDMNNAKDMLKREGHSIVSITEAGALAKQISFGAPKVKSKDLMVFCRQFNSLLHAGVSILVALDMLADQTEKKALKTAIKNLHDNVQKGDSLAAAMKKEQVFPPLLINMVEAGEASGNVEKSLISMAEHFEKDNRIKSLVKKALIYPIILLSVAVIVLVIMVVAVIPKFSDMFKDMGTDLPAITKGLMSLSESITSHWYIYIAVIVGLIVGIKLFKRTDVGIHFFAKTGIKLPVFGNLTIKTAAARFARTFSTMMGAGMPMVEALEVTSRTMDNIYFREAVEKTALGVQKGLPLNQPLKQAAIFPPLIIHMVGIGEESGNLEEMLDNCAGYFEEEVESATQQVMALMEPMIILVLAGIVVLILAAIYGPMIQLYDALGDM